MEPDAGLPKSYEDVVETCAVEEQPLRVVVGTVGELSAKTGYSYTVQDPLGAMRV
jgi:hypothetical protein